MNENLTAEELLKVVTEFGYPVLVELNVTFKTFGPGTQIWIGKNPSFREISSQRGAVGDKNDKLGLKEYDWSASWHDHYSGTFKLINEETNMTNPNIKTITPLIEEKLKKIAPEFRDLYLAGYVDESLNYTSLYLDKVTKITQEANRVAITKEAKAEIKANDDATKDAK